MRGLRLTRRSGRSRARNWRFCCRSSDKPDLFYTCDLVVLMKSHMPDHRHNGLLGEEPAAQFEKLGWSSNTTDEVQGIERR